jgi:hypothetical protein
MYARSSGASATTLYRSSDSGATWSTTTSATQFRGIVCSSDGLTVLTGRGATSRPSISTDGGVNFTFASVLPSGNWDVVAISADGTTMIAGRSSTGRLYITRDSGANWFDQTALSSGGWLSAAINTTGTKVLAGATTTKPYIGVPPS